MATTARSRPPTPHAAAAASAVAGSRRAAPPTCAPAHGIGLLEHQASDCCSTTKVEEHVRQPLMVYHRCFCCEAGTCAQRRRRPALAAACASASIVMERHIGPGPRHASAHGLHTRGSTRRLRVKQRASASIERPSGQGQAGAACAPSRSCLWWSPKTLGGQW